MPTSRDQAETRVYTSPVGARRPSSSIRLALRVALAVVGLAGALLLSDGQEQDREPNRFGLFGVLGARSAFARGFPWDVYLIDVGGGEPRRLTHLAADEISIAWSPDGAHLVLYGPDGLRVIDQEGRATSIVERRGYGGIDWSR